MHETLEDILKERTREGDLYEKLPNDWLRCYACGHLCRIPPGAVGVCKVRFNDGGVLKVPWGYVGGLQIDPIEKKPFFHALPGSPVLSFGMLGCDLHCSYCFTGETSVMTERGPQTLEAIFDQSQVRTVLEDGEAAAAGNRYAVTDRARPRKIGQVFRHAYRGPLVVIKPEYLPALRCTPEHRVLAASGNGENRIEEVEARFLTREHWLVVPKPNFCNAPSMLDCAAVLKERKATYRVPRSLNPAEVELIMAESASGTTSRELGDRFERDPSYIRHVRSRVRRGSREYERVRGIARRGERVRSFESKGRGVPARVALDGSLARMLGFYCAEGRVTRLRNRRNSLVTSFSFAIEETHLHEELLGLIRQVLGLEANISKRRTSTAVVVSDNTFGALMIELCGRRALEKRVPECILNAEPSLVRRFLDAYIAGDGHVYEDGKRSATTVSRTLAEGVAWLALRLGMMPSVYASPRPQFGIIEGRTVRQAPFQYTVVWRAAPPLRHDYVETREAFLVPVRSIETEGHDGFVYNLEVEEDHSYLAGLLAVKNCQNWITSQALRDPAAFALPEKMTAETVVRLAEDHRVPVIASTYNEPLITSEWAVEILRGAKEKGIRGAYVSNGNATPEVLDYLRPWVDFYKVDLKSFDDRNYRKLGALLENVLRTIRMVKERGFWLEVVTLVVPGFNDSDEELGGMARFIASVSPDVPWHVTAFHQDYKMLGNADTPSGALLRAARIGEEAGLHYVYAGNVPGAVRNYEDTRCPSCATTLIRRFGMRMLENRLRNGCCPKCGTAIPGVWS